MPDGMYDRDALAWSEQQADLLERLAAGERVNAKVDWPNVIEEVRDVGQSQLRACRSLLRQAMTHLLKLHAWPRSRSASHWRDEAAVFIVDAEDRFAPSMRQQITLDGLYNRALRLVRITTDDSGAPRPLPGQCPWTVDDLLAEELDIAGLVSQLGNARA